MDEDTLFALLKNSPEFDRLPLPAHWFKKYSIPPREAQNTRDFMNSGYTQMRQNEIKDLEPIFIDEPQQNGKLFVVPETAPVELKVISKPFEVNGNFPRVLPSLKDDTSLEQVQKSEKE